MLVVVIVTGILFGWIVGNLILDKWVNDNSDDLNNVKTND
jgi:hypothetical protein